MEGRDVILGVVTVVVSVICLVTFVALGWYAVWRLFLSRFSFVRELFGNQQEGGASGEEATRAVRPRGSSRKARRD